MNKKIIASVLAVASVLTVSAGALADDNITVTVNGNNVSFVEITPFIENDHTLVPMREIFEALGADVQWDDETRTVISYDSVSDVSITMQIDSDVMYVNGDAVTLETPAKIVGSSTVVPVRAIAEGMHSVVGWDEATKTVTVEKEIKTEPSFSQPCGVRIFPLMICVNMICALSFRVFLDSKVKDFLFKTSKLLKVIFKE